MQIMSHFDWSERLDRSNSRNNMFKPKSCSRDMRWLWQGHRGPQGRLPVGASPPPSRVQQLLPGNHSQRRLQATLPLWTSARKFSAPVCVCFWVHACVRACMRACMPGKTGPGNYVRFLAVCISMYTEVAKKEGNRSLGQVQSVASVAQNFGPLHHLNTQDLTTSLYITRV